MRGRACGGERASALRKQPERVHFPFLPPAAAPERERVMSAPASPRKVAAAPDARPERPARVVVELTEADIPDVIERLSKPDKAAHEAEITKIDAEIKKLQARTVRHP